MSKLWIYAAAVLVVALVLGQETTGFRFGPPFGNGGGNGNGGFGNQVEPDTGIITRTRSFESCGPLRPPPGIYQQRICTPCFFGIARICAIRDTRVGTFTTTVAPPTTGPTATGPTATGPTATGPTSPAPPTSS